MKKIIVSMLSVFLAFCMVGVLCIAPAKAADTEKENGKLLHDFKVVNGKVKDTVTGKVVEGLKVCKSNPNYFVGDDKTKIALGGNWDETIEAVIDYNEQKLGDAYPVFYSYIPSWIEPSPNAAFNFQFHDGIYDLKFERAAKDPYESHWISVDSNYLRKDGMYVYKNLPKKDVFVATATDYTNGTSHTRVNETTANVSLVNKSNAYRYYRYAVQEIVVTSHHKIKELKIYKGARSVARIKADYKKTKISKTITETKTGTDGIVGLGCANAWTVNSEGRLVQQDLSGKKAGIYKVKTATGKTKTVGIAKFQPVPDKKVSNRGYRSLHITNKRKTLLKGKQYPLNA